MPKLAFLFALVVFALPTRATAYFLSPSGNDSNSGLSTGSPWLTPNHSVNCGDTLTAAASTSYSSANFGSGKWGTVTCPGNNNVAWVQCVTFAACGSSDSSIDAMKISANYWGVQGFTFTTPAGNGACIAIVPPSTVSIHHIIIANNVISNCFFSGITSAPNGSAGVDYLAIIGNAVYNAAQTSSGCQQGISIYEPVATDSLPGTHIYIAGNFAWGNVDHNPCDGGAPTDGEGIVLDTLNGCQTSMPLPYAQQIAVVNNITVFNGGRGTLIGGGCAGVSNTLARVYFRNITAYGNNTDTNQNVAGCGEIELAGTTGTQISLSIGAAALALGCGANAIYGISVINGDSTQSVNNSFAFGQSGQNTLNFNNPGFSFGPNLTTGVSPAFANPVKPSAPSCGSASSVPNCMATVIANFTPTNASASGFGYQTPSGSPVVDALFPQWLCSVTNFPAGLVSMGCLAAPGSGITNGSLVNGSITN